MFELSFIQEPALRGPLSQFSQIRLPQTYQKGVNVKRRYGGPGYRALRAPGGHGRTLPYGRFCARGALRIRPLSTPGASNTDCEWMEDCQHDTTLLRRNKAHFLILHMIAARTPGYVIDGQMHHAATILTMCCNPESLAAPLHTTRAKSPSRT